MDGRIRHASGNFATVAPIVPVRDRDPQHLGYLWGKQAYGAMLFATALTNESMADVLAVPAYRTLYIALAREILRVAAAEGSAEASTASTPGVPTTAPPAAAERSLDALVATTGDQQVAQRHLARPRRAQAARPR